MSEPAAWIRASCSPVVPGTRIHALALTPLVLWVLWWSWTTFYILVCTTVVFIVLEVKGRKPLWIIARQRSRLRRGHVKARPRWYLRRRNRIESYEDVEQTSVLSMGAAVDVGPTDSRAPGKTLVSPPQRRPASGSRPNAGRASSSGSGDR